MDANNTPLCLSNIFTEVPLLSEVSILYLEQTAHYVDCGPAILAPRHPASRIQLKFRGNMTLWTCSLHQTFQKAASFSGTQHCCVRLMHPQPSIPQLAVKHLPTCAAKLVATNGPGTRIVDKSAAVCIIADRDIKSGEEITIEYTDIDEHWDRKERSLKLQHWVTECMCTKCTSEVDGKC
ncbi:uncharacterized protein LY89DRAFT_78975 [Mollisia scopiformis]|uniref:SET domain-containing protein n=1 Tax=Mollisia scopiformis TaxID=149040 RepID=A0A194X846_MOLSC|nr:uncharacterized protein LY89DRAFT_78975 [Mollisia scopiformis]KUJ16284.1 hypothetical protein LY89DRAFT_78975 [Mollisia scopiformis]